MYTLSILIKNTDILIFTIGLYIFAPINRNFMVTYFDACEILEMLSEASVKVGKEGAMLEREMDKISPGFLVQITKVGSSVWGFIGLSG